MIKINVLGSCISRIILLNGNKSGRGIADENLDLEYFLDKNNIVCCMTPKPFPDEEIDEIRAEELYDPKRNRSLKQGLKKETVQMLMDGEAEFLVIDLYDFHNDMAFFNNTCFSTCAHEFFNTGLYTKNHEEISVFNFMKIPSFIWYGYIDLFFAKILEKYDSNHIILNRFRSNSHYFLKDGSIGVIPDEFKKPYHSNDCYNADLKKLEDYIIKKFNIYTIDLSEYFIGDSTYWDNLNGAHFQREFYTESFEILKHIIFEQPDRRIFDTLDFAKVSEFLKREKLSEDSFKVYLSHIRKPRTGFLPLDDAFSCLSDKSISTNRIRLSDIYTAADKIRDILLDTEHTSQHKTNILIDSINMKDDFSNGFGTQIKIAAEYHDCNDIEKLLSTFDSLINTDNLLWIKIIDRVEKIAPDNKDVVYLKLQYYKAIEDQKNAAVYTKKYNRIDSGINF